jgi:hypothetical protein
MASGTARSARFRRVGGAVGAMSRVCHACTYLLARGVGVVLRATRHAPLQLWPAEGAAYSWSRSSPAAVLRCARAVVGRSEAPMDVVVDHTDVPHEGDQPVP